MSTLNSLELERYNRHILLPEIGLAGQRKLKASRVLIVGIGGLGCPAALYLAATGVGKLGLVDDDKISTSNLQRQILFNQTQIGSNKAQMAANFLRSYNPDLLIAPLEFHLNRENAQNLFLKYDLILDCTDNFFTRYLINDVAIQTGRPYIFASIYRFQGQLSVFNHQAGPCLRCLYPEDPTEDQIPACNTTGVVGALPGIIGSMQAMEAIKLIIDAGDILSGRLLNFDSLNATMRSFNFNRNPACPACQKQASNSKANQTSQNTPPMRLSELSESTSTDIPLHDAFEISPEQIATMEFDTTSIQLIDVREKYENEINRINGSQLFPLSQIQKDPRQFPENSKIIFYCKSGTRSWQALVLLRNAGHKNVLSLRGGIDAYIERIEPDMDRY